MKDPIVIVGAGLAAYLLAREFRKLNTDTPLLMVTADAGHFYSKPQLSVALTGKKSPDALIITSAARMAEQLGIQLVAETEVSAIQPDQHKIIFDHASHRYHKLVLAVGAEPKRPPLAGSAKNKVLVVNHLRDYAKFRTLISNKKNITLLGAGLIGCEFANDLVNTGHTVHVITPAPTPLELLLPEDMGRLFQEALTRHGVHFHTHCTAAQIDHADNDGYQITLSNGDLLRADVVLSATGLRPDIALARDAGIQVDLGIITDHFLETSAPDIYAIGDCAEVGGFVLPYIMPLQNEASALAKTLAGTPTTVKYPAMPVVVKTPACPLVVCPQPRGVEGSWESDITEQGARALFHDSQGVLRGFVLMGKRIVERTNLVKQIPPLI